MIDGPLMLLVNWLVADTIHLQSNDFASGVKINARGELKPACKDSPDFMNIRLKGHCHAIWQLYKKPKSVFASVEFQN